MKDKQRSQIASLTQTRDTLVLRTALKNKANNLLFGVRDQLGQRCANYRDFRQHARGRL